MDENFDVKFTVTRLRRRHSVEQSDDGSSPASSTPTKKPGGRLVAKPQLELIDENTPVSSPRKTRRKSLATDVEEKPITPSRRSARIKSNSSIVSETHSVQATDSPRAKRAARRNSQAGSDNEGPATPARQTRRTRKDSASSVENQESGSLTRPLPVAEMVIEEEPENEVNKASNKSESFSTPATDELSPNSARKSKRLLEKKNRRSGSHDSSVENQSINISTTNEKASPEIEPQSSSPLNKSVKPKESNDNLSESNMSLIKQLDIESKINRSNHNKSASALDAVRNDKTKRNRTESWPKVATPVTNDSVNFSDNELSKKKKEKSDKIKSLITSIINVNDDSIKIDKTNTSINDKITCQPGLDTSSNRKKRESENSFTKDTVKPEDIPAKEVLPPKEDNTSNKETVCENSDNTDIIRDMGMLFESAPGNVQAIVYFEDSESNSVGTGTANIGRLDSEDQCVPVVKHNFQENVSLKEPTEKSDFPNPGGNDKISCTDVSIPKDIDGGNNSCEPMDIDETIHEEILQKSLDTSRVSNQERKSLSQNTTKIDETDKSRRKSSISNSATDNLDKSNENKSTLILSQIKDVSSTTDQLPISTQINEVLLKSDNVHEDNNKKSNGNVSVNDGKGTPKQKVIQKLTMQTSTPITTQQLDVKTKTDGDILITKQVKSNFSKSINDADSSEEESASSGSENEKEKRKLLDDEAEEASDNYESGDSQDEEERRYEAENEIVERGETLTSHDDMSNDTDYEKDSFIVSSDAEDNELLSGSSDDLSMGDNELSMSKKSKNKFNERKVKEQKKASREIFESRHRLSTSDQKSPPPKTKKNRMRLDSSLLSSDEEVVVKPKKSNRMRLNSTLDTNVQQDDTNISLKKSKLKDNSMQDSTHDTSVKQDKVTDVALEKSKKIYKSTRESIGNHSAIEENEITVRNESTIDSTDPLQILKQEPKTPQKDLNISVVQFTDKQEIENVHITESSSIWNQTGTDPLQATVAGGDSSDSSDNVDIIQNYDSILNELNKETKTKLNNNNISLNMGNKTKKNRVEPIVDQLNLTRTKKPKKNNDSEAVLESKITGTSQKKQDSDNEESSSSIDLQLLFSEDNCGSEDEQITKPKQNKPDDDDNNMFIPLKKSLGKTDLRESVGLNVSQEDSTPNESAKTKKKRKSSLGPVESIEEQDMNTSQPVTTLSESSKKKNKRKSSLVPPETVEELDLSRADNESVLNKSRTKKSNLILEPAEELEDRVGNESILNKSNSKKKKQRTSITAAESQQLQESIQADDNNLLNKSSSKKKKNRASFAAETAAEPLDNGNKSEDNNDSLNESGTKKKKKHSISEPAVLESQEIPNALESVLNESSKKKKRKSSLTAEDIENAAGELFFIDTRGTLEDKANCGEDGEPSLNASFEGKKKKKKNKSAISPNKNTIEESNAAVVPMGEKKKKKKISQKLESLVCDDDSDGAPDEAPYISEKATDADLQNIGNVSESVDTGSGKKKKKKKKTTPAASNQSAQSIDTNDNIPSNSKNRKRKSSNAESSQNSEDGQDSQETGTVNETANSHKKKRKISHGEENNTSGASESKHTKKKKTNHDVHFQDSEITGSLVKKSKKRKHRDEDGDSKQTKVSKENSFQEVHVPRLPDSILNQLDDKPRKSGAAKVISTTNFIVENARQKRVKPSNYLEESIYLDANSPMAKKEKPRIKQPKVLPFIPTASISDSGFTTNFKINNLSQATKFEAEPICFFKESYLQKKNIKRLGTYDRYKKQMHHKMSKF